MLRFNLTADGSSEIFEASGSITYLVSGTFGGGTASLDVRDDETDTFVTITDTEVTADSQLQVLMDGWNTYRVTLSGATAPNLVYELFADNISTPR